MKEWYTIIAVVVVIVVLACLYKYDKKGEEGFRYWWRRRAPYWRYWGYPVMWYY